MPLHDHPNMCVYFRMLFGKLNYQSYDKVDERFRYNKFSLDEYYELIEQKKRIGVKLTTETTLSGPQFMMVRPSRNNLHQFIAEENTCFFDICLPNYTNDSLRRITYFKDVASLDRSQDEVDACEVAAAESTLYQSTDLSKIDTSKIADKTLESSSRIDGLKFIEYYTTPPRLPVNFEIADLSYIGEMREWKWLSVWG